MAFKLDARTRATAEAQSAELARLGQLLQDASWAIDSALSGYDKDRAGYRTRNAANPDGGENFDPADLDEAIRSARAILASCNPIQDLIARREALAEQAARTERAADPLAFEERQLDKARRLGEHYQTGPRSFLAAFGWFGRGA